MADFDETEPILDTPDAMSWPVLPGESVNQLAGLFYPGNQAMQKRFISKTLALSQEINPNLAADTVFKEPSTLIVPDLKALSKESKSKAFKSEHRRKSKFPALHLSYKIADSASFKVSPEMQADFDDLTKRNSKLKDELQKLNERLVKLQLVLSNMFHEASKAIASNVVTPATETDKPKKIAKATEPPAQVNQAQAKTADNKPVIKNTPENAAQQVKPIPISKPAQTVVTPPVAPSQPVAPAPMPVEPVKPAPAVVKAESFDSVVKPTPPSVPQPQEPKPEVPNIVTPHNLIKSEDDSLLNSSIVEIIIELAVIAIGLLLAFVAWRWIRKGIAKQIRKITNAQLDAMHKNKFDPNNPIAFHPSKPGAVDSPDLSMLSIEEFESVVEEARIFMSMERPAEAIAMLRHHLDEQPRSSLHPWIYLLDIYQDQDKREEFIELGKRFHETFNVIAPLWHTDTQAGMVIAESLEEFPHIIEKLQQLWGKPEAKVYLEDLISDNRGGERGGFSFEVIKDMMMLLGVIDLRDKKLTL